MKLEGDFYRATTQETSVGDEEVVTVERSDPSLQQLEEDKNSRERDLAAAVFKIDEGEAALEKESSRHHCANGSNGHIRTPSKTARPPLYTYMLAFCAALNSVNDGFDMGVGSGMSIYVKQEWHLNNLELGFFFGCLSFMAALGGLCSHSISDRCGRRFSFVTAQVTVIFGIAIVTFAPNFPIVMVGRVLIGLGVGMGFSIDPLYIAEVTPASHRGQLTSWCDVATNLGITMGFVVNWALADLPAGRNWRAMAGCGIVLPVILMFLAIWVMPESPRWLVAQGRESEAAAVLRKTHAASEDIEALVGEIRADVQKNREQKHRGWPGWRPLICPHPGARLLIWMGLGVAVAQQINGSASVVFYAPKIFQDAGVGRSDSQRFAMTMLMGATKTTFDLVAAFCMDSMGRRPLLLWSMAGQAASMALLCCGLTVAPRWLAVVAVNCFVAWFSLGIGPICWVYASELFPSHLRAKGMGLAVFLNRIFNGLTTLTFPLLSDALGGQDRYFAIAACVTAALGVGIFFFAPETKQQTLEQLGSKCRIVQPDAVTEPGQAAPAALTVGDEVSKV